MTVGPARMQTVQNIRPSVYSSHANSFNHLLENARILGCFGCGPPSVDVIFFFRFRFFDFGCEVTELEEACLSQTAYDSFDFEDAGCEVDLTELEEACVSLRWSQTADDSFD